MNSKTPIQFLEDDFLCRVLCSFVTGKNCPNIPANFNWDRLERVINRNKLIPIFYFMLNKQQVPLDRLRRWKHISIGGLARYYKAKKATLKLFSILEKEKIPAVVLRGMALTQWIYLDPALRPMRDVDILVPTDSRLEFIERIKKHGLTPIKIFRSQFIYHIDNIIFEIHWSFLTPKRYRKAADFNKWFASKRIIKIDGAEIYCLKPENELLDLICHVFIHHELDRLLQVIDIALLLQNEKLDWEYLRVWCRNASMTRLFCFTLAYVDYFFDLGLQKHSDFFGVQLPPNINKIFEAYTARLFGGDSLSHFFIRKKNMLFVAEQHILKFKQFLRFVSLDEINNLLLFIHKRK